MSSNPAQMLDADAWDAISLGGTLLLRDTVLHGKTEVKKPLTLTVSQYIYNKTIKTNLEGMIRGFTNESYFSALLANSVGLSAYFLAADAVGLTSKKSDPSESEGIVPDVKVKGKMTKKVVNALLESMELLVEQQGLLWATQRVSGWAPPAGQPQPAKTA